MGIEFYPMTITKPTNLKPVLFQLRFESVCKLWYSVNSHVTYFIYRNALRSGHPFFSASSSFVSVQPHDENAGGKTSNSPNPPCISTTTSAGDLGSTHYPRNSKRSRFFTYEHARPALFGSWNSHSVQGDQRSAIREPPIWVPDLKSLRCDFKGVFADGVLYWRLFHSTRYFILSFSLRDDELGFSAIPSSSSSS
ncbi:hypothetical protein ACLOJK_035847 [Asimina triloba]